MRGSRGKAITFGTETEEETLGSRNARGERKKRAKREKIWTRSPLQVKQENNNKDDDDVEDGGADDGDGVVMEARGAEKMIFFSFPSFWLAARRNIFSPWIEHLSAIK